MNTQELQFELMKKASFNDFQAEQVVGDLKANAHLWDAALMDQPGLMKLRDLPEDIWNVSTLYILTGIKKRSALTSWLFPGTPAASAGSKAKMRQKSSTHMYPEITSSASGGINTPTRTRGN